MNRHSVVLPILACLTSAPLAAQVSVQSAPNRSAISLFFPPGTSVSVGPGGDFPDIQSAVDFIPSGAVIEVFDGTYAGFVVDDKSVKVIGSGNTRIDSDIRVQNVGSSDLVALADLDATALDVLGAPGCVLVDGMRFSEDFGLAAPDRNRLVGLFGAADVRMRGTTLDLQGTTTSLHGIEATAARVEIASGTLIAADGADAQDGLDGFPAGAGLVVGNGARVHVALTSAAGGDGGTAQDFGELGGDAGPAILLEDASDLIVSGLPNQELRGGAGGLSLFGYDGAGGSAIELFRDGQPKIVRLSGVTLIPGLGGPSGADGLTVGPILPGDIVDNAQVPDPSLEVIGNPVSGNPAATTVRIWAVPGANVVLQFGRKATVQNVGGAAVEQLVVSTATFPLGPVSPSGFVEMDLFLGGIERGGVAFVQGEVTFMGQLERTNSGALVVR